MARSMGFVEFNEVAQCQMEWVDCETSKPISDQEIRNKYLLRIMEGCGIRFLDTNSESEQLQAHIPSDDLPPFKVERDAAEAFQRQYADRIKILPATDPARVQIRIFRGAQVLLPKSTSSTRAVAGMVPQGWTASRYGITTDMIAQVDQATLYVLVSVAETLLSAGITDFYEFYNYIPTSEVGMCVGSGLRGISSLRKMYKDQYQGEAFGDGVRSDILQETFINTAAAWVNMLLLGANGPLNTPVGACATGLESLDKGCDLISSGKAQICLTGGYDDLSREISMSFDRMKATVDIEDELARAREPHEMSRPVSSTRAGFIESHRCAT